MATPDEIVVRCDDPERILRVIGDVMPSLPKKTRDQLHLVMFSYFSRYGHEGLHARSSNKTVAQILSEYDSSEDLETVAAGEVDETSYQVLRVPDEPKDDDVQATDESKH